MNYQNLIKNYCDQLLEDLFGLLKINSTLIEQPDNTDAPFGEGCKQALLYMLNLGDKYGFKTKNIDNIAGHIEYGEGEEIVAVLCHVDVVPAEGEWEHDPYDPIIKNGKVYARGTIDDKGPAISALYALRMLKDNEVKLNKSIRLIIGTDEETNSRGLTRYLQVEPMPNLGFSPDAQFPLIYGEKGIMSMDIISNDEPKELVFKSGNRYNIVPSLAIASGCKSIKDFKNFLEENNYQGECEKEFICHGVASHAMEPKNGINAAVRLAEFLKDVSPLSKFVSEVLSDSRLNNVGLGFTDSEMGDLTMNMAVVDIENGQGKAGLNYRYPVRWDKEQFIKDLSELALKYNLEVRVIGDSIPHYISPNDFLVQTLYRTYQEYTNDSTPMATIGGGTYARSLKHAVAFGQVFPGEEDLAHQANENIDIEKMFTSSAIYALAVERLGK